MTKAIVTKNGNRTDCYLTPDGNIQIAVTAQEKMTRVIVLEFGPWDAKRLRAALDSAIKERET